MPHKFSSAIIFALILICASAANAQQRDRRANKILKQSAKVSVIVVGKTAKTTWKVTKFAGREIVVPITEEIAIPVATKVVSKLAVSTFNVTVDFAQKEIPVAADLLVKYLKFRLAPWSKKFVWQPDKVFGAIFYRRPLTRFVAVRSII